MITDETNLIVFGSSKVIFNMNCDGKAEQVLHQDILQLLKLNTQELRFVCILSGCGYLPSLRGIGFKSAQDIVRRRRTLNEVKTNKCPFTPSPNIFLKKTFMFRLEKKFRHDIRIR